MMRIRNKKTGHEYDIDEAGWQKLSSEKLNRLYTIISRIKSPVSKKLHIPDKIVEFQAKIQKPRRIEEIKPKPKK